MGTNRDKLQKGLQFIAIGFPFIFLGPILLTWLGIPKLQEESYTWLIVSILFMGAAGFFSVKGLLTILSAFFDS